MSRCFALSLVLALVACSDDARPAADASSGDASADVSLDDASTDAGDEDGGTDGGEDAIVDADAAADAAEDAPDDSGEDASADASMDANADVAVDAGPDVSDGGADVGAGGTNCDKSMIRCRIPEPVCGELEVPEITPDGSCYTLRCVPIEMCVCERPSQCSNELLYTCRRDTGRCTPPL